MAGLKTEILYRTREGKYMNKKSENDSKEKANREDYWRPNLTGSIITYLPQKPKVVKAEKPPQKKPQDA